ncbi:MAG: bacteriocin family protein [Chloroflexi bacterium]|nr:bacteriocin family protein [Chloroflexota bacterium]
MDYLQRDQAPLNATQWRSLDDAVIRTAQLMLVGRRVIPIVGPLGAGVEVIHNDIITGRSTGQIDLLGNDEGETIGIEHRHFLPLPLIYKDFWIHWRDLESNLQVGVPLDTGKAAAAAAAAAQAEDHMIFHGYPPLGLPGLLTAEGRQTQPLSDWNTTRSAFNDVVAGVQQLINSGFTGPFALMIGPHLYALLNRVFDESGVLEIERIERLARAGVYPTAMLPDNAAILLDSGPENLDITVGLDLSTAYVESRNLNHRFRVLESLALRVRRPASILTYEGELSDGGSRSQSSHHGG